MKTIALTAPGRLEVRGVDAPRPAPGHVLVQVGQVGICGSDMHIYREGEIGGIRAPLPWILGHECMGTVTEAGEGANPDLVGRRVAVEPHRPCGHCAACRDGMVNACLNDSFLGLPPTPGALTEYVTLAETQVEPIPDHVSDEEGVLLEPLAIALHAIHLVKPSPGDAVAIVGTGVLGSCVLVLLQQVFGIRPICVDLLPDRLERAKALGAAAVITAESGNPEATTVQIMDQTGGDGASRIFECAGKQETLRVSCDAAAPGAHIGIIGIPDEPTMTFPASSTRRRGLTLRLVRRSLKTLTPCIEYMAQRRLAARGLVTHTFNASAASEAFETVHDYRDGVLKAVIDMRQW